jgi:hypothetical protein
VTAPAKRWAQLADDLEFEQLGNARTLAEGWRTGLVGLTALLAAVTIFTGPGTVTGLVEWLRFLIVALLALAFVLLIAGSLTATRAASGAPGEEIYLDADELRRWTFNETKSIQRDIVRAARFMLGGLAALALAIGLSWLGPRAATGSGDLITVQRDGIRTCGTLLSETGRALLLGDPTDPTAAPQSIALSAGTVILPTNQC